MQTARYQCQNHEKNSKCCLSYKYYRLHFWKQTTLCKNEADLTYIMRNDTWNPLFLSNQRRDCSLARLHAFSQWCNVAWSMIFCGKFEKKAKFFKILLSTGGHLQWHYFLVILMSHLSLVVVFRLGKNCGKFQSGNLLAHLSLVVI